MKHVLWVISFALLLLTTSCKVTFTSDLRSKIEAQKLDLKKIQYYNSQKITLSRVLSTSDTRVASGEVRLQNGLQIEIIKIKKNTPGICDSLFDDGMIVRFEQEKGRILHFKKNAYGEYQLKADDLDSKSMGSQTSDGYAQFFAQNKGEVMYDGKKYFINTSLTSPKLKIKKTESSKFAKSSRKASGVRVQ